MKYGGCSFRAVAAWEKYLGFILLYDCPSASEVTLKDVVQINCRQTRTKKNKMFNICIFQYYILNFLWNYIGTSAFVNISYLTADVEA